MRVQGGIFRDTTVELDNNEFISCTFERCVLIYRAAGAVVMDGCTITDSGVRLEDAALRTIGFLGGISRGSGLGGRVLVESLFATILGPPPPPSSRLPS